MDEGEVFNMYREVPSVAKKASWSLNKTQALSDPNFTIGTVEDDQQVLRNLIGFYGVTKVFSSTAASPRSCPWGVATR